jgi:ESS family glutamate:Na+ symporter
MLSQAIDYLLAGLVLLAALGVAFLITKSPGIRKFYLPASLIAGFLLLILGPQVIGQFFPDYHIEQHFYETWFVAPGLLINVVFACLFLARPLIPVKQILQMAGPQIAFGQMLAWGQYLVGGLVALFLLMPLFDAPPFVAALLEISFEGGHGTVSGMSAVFDSFGYPEGRVIARGLATASLVTALVLGILIINWAKKRQYFAHDGVLERLRGRMYYVELIDKIKQKGVAIKEHLTPKNILINVSLVALSIGVGWVTYRTLYWLDDIFLTPFNFHIMPYLPLFIFCMFGGIIVNIVCQKLHIRVSRHGVNLVSEIALGAMIMTAVGTMSLDFITHDGAVFGILYLAGVLWITLATIVLARRMFGKNWFQNAIISFGQSMGMTATGLLFAEMVDPKNETNAVESFGYKQMFFEFLMGGGVVTALSMLFIGLMGLPIFTAVCGVIAVFWMFLGIFHFGRHSKKPK